MPWLGASDSRTFRGMTVSKTRVAEVASNLGGHVGGELRAPVEHGQHDALHHERRVEVVADEIERGEQLGQSF